MTRSIISGSTVERRVHCPGSVAEIHLPSEPQSPYAAEGTRLHKLMEDALSDHLPPHIAVEDTKFWQVYIAMQDFMKKREITSYDLEVSNAHEGKPDMKGTLDFVGASSDTTYIVDYKFGSGVRVSPVENFQLAFYANGVAEDPLAKRENLVFAIAQPWRGQDTIQEWHVPPEWFAAYKHLEKATYHRIKGGDRSLKAGPWCNYCRLAPTCSEANKALLHADLPDDPQGLSGVELADLLARGERAVRQYKRLQAYAQEYLTKGGDVPGKKLVETPGIRRWIDEKKVVERFGAIAYEQRVLSPAQLEKAAQKAKIDVELADLVTRAKVRKIVDVAHKAPAVTPGADLVEAAKAHGLYA